MTERLTNLDNVKDWLDITNTDMDSFLILLIDAASQYALNYLNRDSFQARDYTQRFHGNRKQNMLLRNWPVVSITSVGIDGTVIPASVFDSTGKPTDGYAVSDPRNAPQSLDLNGCYWYFGHCQVIYTAGFQDTQTTVIPAPVAPATVGTILAQQAGIWSLDMGVTINGVTATKVASAPDVGQYSVDDWGTYSFNTADATKTAAIKYGFTPFDMAFAVTEFIGNWFKRRDRIGILSKTLGGQETITFTQKDMTDGVKMTFQNYKNEIPV